MPVSGPKTPSASNYYRQQLSLANALTLSVGGSGGGGGGGGGATISDAINGQHGIGEPSVDYVIYNASTGTANYENALSPSLNDVLTNQGRTTYKFDIPVEWSVCRFQLYGVVNQASTLTSETSIELFGSTSLSASVLVKSNYTDAVCLSALRDMYFEPQPSPVISFYKVIGKTYNEIGALTSRFFVAPTFQYGSSTPYFMLPLMGITAYIETCYIAPKPGDPTKNQVNVIFKTTGPNSILLIPNNYAIVISKVPS